MRGTTVASFELLEKIGGGGMGVVYKARDLALGRFVALKFLPSELGADRLSKARFLQEARAASRLDHPNICTIYQVEETADGQMYIVMGYYEGETVEQKLARRPLALAEALDVAAQAASGLFKAHQQGITHRDIKPANLLVTAGGLVKILDFGIAKLAAQAPLTRDGAAVGTLPYMSPEQLSGDSVDPQTDIWALGVVLYQMITGRLPFAADNPGAVVHAILHRQPPRLSDFRHEAPEALEQTLAKMLAKDRRHRFRDCAEVVAHLRGLGSAGRAGTPADLPTHTQPVLTAPPEPSLAVLPFVNLSGDREQEYFSDGITEDILAQLSKLSGIRVIARTSVMRYKTSATPLADIARELKISHVVEGSVRRAGNRVRITCGFVEAATSRQLWSETYDRELSDIFAIQTDVARQIAAALSAALGPAPKRRLVTEQRNIHAYPLFLRARYFLHKVSPDGFLKAIGLFEQALAIDPHEARCHAGLSTCYALGGHFDFLPPREAFPKAKGAAGRALALDEQLAEAHASMALVQMFHEWQWAAAELSFRRALALEPSWPEAHTYYSWCLCARQSFEGAVGEARRALQLDPVSAFAGANLGWVLAMAGRFDEAVRQLESTLELNPNYPAAATLLGGAHLARGETEKAFAFLERSPWRLSFLGLAYAWTGQKARARRMLEQLPEAAPGSWRPSEVALLCLSLGEREQAARWLETAYQERDYMLSLQYPKWVREPADPLVIDYLRRMGL